MLSEKAGLFTASPRSAPPESIRGASLWAFRFYPCPEILLILGIRVLSGTKKGQKPLLMMPATCSPICKHVPITRALAIALASAEIFLPAKKRLLYDAEIRAESGIE